MDREGEFGSEPIFFEIELYRFIRSFLSVSDRIVVLALYLGLGDPADSSAGRTADSLVELGLRGLLFSEFGLGLLLSSGPFMPGCDL